MRCVCTFCSNAHLNRCHSTMGVISRSLFQGRDTATFTRQFKRHVAVLFPDWFIPPIAALGQLLSGFTFSTLVLLVLFCLVAFVILPVFSSKGTCDECAVREECPWSKARSSR